MIVQHLQCLRQYGIFPVQIIVYRRLYLDVGCYALSYERFEAIRIELPQSTNTRDSAVRKINHQRSSG